MQKRSEHAHAFGFGDAAGSNQLVEDLFSFREPPGGAHLRRHAGTARPAVLEHLARPGAGSDAQSESLLPTPPSNETPRPRLQPTVKHLRTVGAYARYQPWVPPPLSPPASRSPPCPRPPSACAPLPAGLVAPLLQVPALVARAA